LEVHEIQMADHTFSDTAERVWLETLTVDWLRGIGPPQTMQISIAAHERAMP
jgi:hypothetical protein